MTHSNTSNKHMCIALCTLQVRFVNAKQVVRQGAKEVGICSCKNKKETKIKQNRTAADNSNNMRRRQQQQQMTIDNTIFIQQPPCLTYAAALTIQTESEST